MTTSLATSCMGSSLFLREAYRYSRAICSGTIVLKPFDGSRKSPHHWTTTRRASSGLDRISSIRVRRPVNSSLGEQPASDRAPEQLSAPSDSLASPETTRSTAPVQELGSGEGNNRNQIIALLSVVAAVGLFVATKLGNGGVDLKLLASSSLPYDLAISNGRPTVVEFYADWCEVCRELAPEVYAVEQDYSDKINFVMLNIDNVKWAQELAEFGVEGIPHFVFLDAQGNEEGNVVGKLPRKVLEANLEALARGDASVPFSRVIGQYSVKGERGAPAVVEPRSHSS